MTDTEMNRPTPTLVFETEFKAPPDKVWRAVSRPEFRERWLPREDLATAEPVALVPGEEILFRMRDGEPPHLESVVTFQLRPGANGGTRLRVLHALTDARALRWIGSPANGNGAPVMRAA